MAVARVGTTSANFAGSGAVAWPGSSAAGQLAIANVYGTTSGKRTLAGDWISYKHTPSTDHYWKMLTAGDIAAALSVTAGYAVHLTVYSGAGRIGAVSDLGTANPGCTTTAVGSLVHVSGRGKVTLTPAGSVGSDLTLSVYSNRHYNVWPVTGGVPQWYGLTGFNGTDSTSVEIVPTSGPSAPTITAPAPAAVVSAAAALTLSWVHRSAQTGTQDAYKVRAVKDGATTYYLLADGTLSVTDTAVSSSTQGASIDAGQLVSGSSYALSVQTSEDGVWSAWSSLTFSAITPPSVSTVTVSSPAETLTPAVSWTESVTGGQVAYQVRISLAADATSETPLWDSLVIAGAALTETAPALTTWPNGVNLKAWVRVQQPGIWSAWLASSAFTVSWTPPTAPTAVTAANQASGPLQVTVTGLGSRVSLEAQRSADGSTWLPWRLLAVTGASMTLDVPEAPYGVTWQYRARASQTVSSVDLWSAWTTIAAPVASTDRGCYLIADSGAWLAAKVRSDATAEREESFALSYGLDALTARVDYGPPQGWSGLTVLGTSTKAERDALVAWLDAHPVWTWRWSPERSGSTYADAGSIRVARSAALTAQRLAQVTISPRDIPIAWVEQ